MKNRKKIISGFLIFALLFSLLSVPSKEVNASSVYAPSKMHISPYNIAYFEVDYPAYGYSVKNLKSDSSNLKAIQTYDYQEYGADPNDNFAIVHLYGTKSGTYTVSFDVYSTSGEKAGSYKVKVYVNTDTIIKTLKVGKNTLSNLTAADYDGSGAQLAGNTKSNPYYLIGNSGTVKVTMNKGYTLKKIQYGTYPSSSATDVAYKTIKNNKKITYGDTIYQYTTNYSIGTYYRKYWHVDAIKPTYIRITYTDKYTKQEDTLTYIFYKWSN